MKMYHWILYQEPLNKARKWHIFVCMETSTVQQCFPKLKPLKRNGILWRWSSFIMDCTVVKFVHDQRTAYHFSYFYECLLLHAWSIHMVRCYWFFLLLYTQLMLSQLTRFVSCITVWSTHAFGGFCLIQNLRLCLSSLRLDLTNVLHCLNRHRHKESGLLWLGFFATCFQWE